jgi:thiol-disulfide isomerase/thioredoxin
MSSGCSSTLKDPHVLEAFTEAYNDQFIELMKFGQDYSPGPSPVSTDPSSCGLCRQLGGGPPPSLPVASAPLEALTRNFAQIRSPPPPPPAGRCQQIFWIIVLIIVVVTLIILLAGILCDFSKKNLYASAMKMPFVKTVAAIGGGGGGGGGGGIVTKAIMGASPILDPSGVTAPSSSKALVMYHADWCSHCKEMMPLYEKAVAQFGSEKIHFYSCEHSVLEKSGKANMLGVTGYPTIVSFNNGNIHSNLIGNVGSSKLHSFILNILSSDK